MNRKKRWTAIGLAGLCAIGAAGVIVAGCEKAPRGALAPGFKLLDPGARPRRELWYAPRVPSKQTLEMTLTLETGMTLGQGHLPRVSLPPTVLTMDFDVTKVDPDGAIHYDFAYSGAEVRAAGDENPLMVSTMRQSLGQLVGVKGTVVVESDGHTRSGEIAKIENVAPQVEQMLDQMVTTVKQVSNRLPWEKVGVGARWQVDDNLTLNGVAITQKTVTTIQKIEGKTIELAVEIEQKGEEQVIRNSPGLPPGMEVTLRSLISQGKGTVVARLDRIAPEKADLSVSQRSIFLMGPSGSEQQVMKTDLTIKTVLETKS